MIWLDLAIVILILLSAVISIFRGFIKEVLSLVAWAAAFYLALRFSGYVARYLEPYITIEPMRLGAAFLGIFFITLILFSLFNYVIAKLVDGTGLSGTDRFLGVIFGLFRGIAIVTVIVVMVGFTPIPDSQQWQKSFLIPYFEKTAVWIKQYIPENLSDSFNSSSSSDAIQQVSGIEWEDADQNIEDAEKLEIEEQ